jgi:DNA-binding beta-propeller fold protein YncE
MKSKLMMFGVCCLLCAVAVGQVIEDTLFLPDTLARGYATLILFDSVSNTLCATSEGDTSLLVVAADTNRRFALLTLNGRVTAMCQSRTGRKAYVACSSPNCVDVIDIAARRLVASLPMPARPNDICWNSALNKVYCTCGDSSAGAVSVIDCWADTVLRVVSVGLYPDKAVCDSAANRVYCTVAFGDDIAVIDCTGDSLQYTIGMLLPEGTGHAIALNVAAERLYVASDSVLAIVDTRSRVQVRRHSFRRTIDDLCVNTRDNKAYALASETCYVIGHGDTVITRLHLQRLQRSLYYYRPENTVYCGGYDSIATIDGTTDTLKGYIPTWLYTYAMCASEATNRLFVAAGPLVYVVDAGTNRICGDVVLEFWVDDAAYCPVSDRVYFMCTNSQKLLGVDARTQEVVSDITIGHTMQYLYYSSMTNKLYIGFGAWGSDSSLYIVDCAGDSVSALVDAVGHTTDFCSDDRDDKVYCAGHFSGLAVLDGSGDSLIARVPLSLGMSKLTYCPEQNKVYGCTYSTPPPISCVQAVDCSGDTVLDTIAVPKEPRDLCYVQRYDRLFCACGGADSLVAIDCVTDSVVAGAAVGDRPIDIAYNAHNDRLYCANFLGEDLTVLQCSTLQRVRAISLPDRPVTVYWDSIANKIYCLLTDGSPYHLAVVDCATDSVMAVFDFGYSQRVTAYAWSPRTGRHYFGLYAGPQVIVVRDTTGLVVAESRPPLPSPVPPSATVVRSVLFLAEALGPKPETASLLDISGRKVMELRPGANDIRALAPGVYFVRKAQTQAMRKVIVAQ